MASATEHAAGETADAWPGARLGLPAQGRGSVAGFGRRLAATLIDLIVAWLIGAAISAAAGFRTGCAHVTTASNGVCSAAAHGQFDRNLVISGTFLVMVALMLALSGRTFGMLLLGLQLLRLDGRPVGLAAIPRTVLLAFVIPAVLYDSDRRALHDRASRTVVVRTT